MNTDLHDQVNTKSQDVPNYKILIKHAFLTGSGLVLRNRLEKKLAQLAK